ncbi:fumarylacetoacetate hydrolase family protein [Hydrogenophaga sp.]|uniref:fumarylacetoacetate hydrolase family protein n=1 Tax=Hydrogenophaga sp. TaxID=1904254 RepID=UPI00271B30AB|nr:fumarylacetoacetate hydrolase family protein [Hydrogenophaga sp.]MDO9437689.1 fumarylacetoacetate hydrolase family protein [Hydrogenophaga sp.]
MKLISFDHEGRSSVGVLTSGGIVDLGRRLGVAGLKDLLTQGLLPAARQAATETPDLQLSAVRVTPVVPDPAHLYCVGVNYRDHLNEVRAAGVQRKEPEHASLFIRFPETLVAADAPLLMPKVSDKLDYEAELAVVIGKGGRYIAEQDALSHVAGYTCFNDASVRDWQHHSSQVTSGKNFMGTGGLGPWMVTADEIPDPQNLKIELRLNGTVMQSSNTRNMIFNVAAIVAYASALVPLKPGDVIATGTPEGVGFSRTPPVFMKAGDVCEVEIEHIGVLRNRVEKAS